jgi:HEAT repeat protein
VTRTRLTLHAFLAAAFLVTPPVLYADDFLGKPVGKWAADMDSQDAQVRRAAAFALSKFPASGNRTVPLLLNAIKSDASAGVRDAAATALGDLLPPFEAHPPREDQELTNLVEIGTRKQAWEEKCAAATQLRANVWAAAESVLRRALEKETDTAALRGALYAVGSFGPEGASMLEAVRGKLGHKEATVRQNAAWALGRLGPKAAEADDEKTRRVLADAAADLVDLLTDGEPLVRRDAATALGEIAAAAADAAKPGDPVPLHGAAVPPLLSMVKREADGVARKAALAKLVDLLNEKDKDDELTLENLLKNKDLETAQLAAFALAKIGGPAAKPALPVLQAALHDDDPDVQRNAAASLGKLKELAGPAMRDLAQILREGKDLSVRRHCAIALALIGPDARTQDGREALPDLVAVLQSDAPPVIRHYAAEALAKNPARESALSDVVKVLAKNGPDNSKFGDRYTINSMRQRCIWCFFNRSQPLPPDAMTTLGNILDETEDASLMVRYDAARTLAKYLKDKTPDKAADVLLQMLRDERLQVYKKTDANVSGGVEGSSGTRIKADTGGDARFMAAMALGDIGKKLAGRKDIIDELRKASAEAKDDKFKTEAKNALQAIEGK